MRKHISLLLLFALIGSMAFAQLPGAKAEKKSDLSAKVPVDKKVKVGKLDNGLTYYIRNKKNHKNRKNQKKIIIQKKNKVKNQKFHG